MEFWASYKLIVAIVAEIQVLCILCCSLTLFLFKRVRTNETNVQLTIVLFDVGNRLCCTSLIHVRLLFTGFVYMQ
jgi:hypothetical protein